MSSAHTFSPFEAVSNTRGPRAVFVQDRVRFVVGFSYTMRATHYNGCKYDVIRAEEINMDSEKCINSKDGRDGESDNL